MLTCFVPARPPGQNLASHPVTYVAPPRRPRTKPDRYPLRVPSSTATTRAGSTAARSSTDPHRRARGTPPRAGMAGQAAAGTCHQTSVPVRPNGILSAHRHRRCTLWPLLPTGRYRSADRPASCLQANPLWPRKRRHGWRRNRNRTKTRRSHKPKAEKKLLHQQLVHTPDLTTNPATHGRTPPPHNEERRFTVR